MSNVEKHYTRNPDFIFRKIVEEMVLVPVHQDVADMDCIYTLNELGAFIWENLDQPGTQADLEQAILAEFEADPNAVQADLAAFLTEMAHIGALQVD